MVVSHLVAVFGIIASSSLIKRMASKVFKSILKNGDRSVPDESLHFLKNIDNYCSVRESEGWRMSFVHCSPATLSTCSSVATRGSLEPILHAYVQRDEPKEEMIHASVKQFQSEFHLLPFSVVRFPLKKLNKKTQLEIHPPPFIVAFLIPRVPS